MNDFTGDADGAAGAPPASHQNESFDNRGGEKNGFVFSLSSILKLKSYFMKTFSTGSLLDSDEFFFREPLLEFLRENLSLLMGPNFIEMTSFDIA